MALDTIIEEGNQERRPLKLIGAVDVDGRQTRNNLHINQYLDSKGFDMLEVDRLVGIYGKHDMDLFKGAVRTHMDYSKHNSKEAMPKDDAQYKAEVVAFLELLQLGFERTHMLPVTKEALHKFYDNRNAVTEVERHYTGKKLWNLWKQDRQRAEVLEEYMGLKRADFLRN
jgi:hypothetical protein